MKILNTLKQEKTQKQLLKVLEACLVCLLLLVLVEVLFQIPIIEHYLSADVLKG